VVFLCLQAEEVRWTPRFQLLLMQTSVSINTNDAPKITKLSFQMHFKIKQRIEIPLHWPQPPIFRHGEHSDVPPPQTKCHPFSAPPSLLFHTSHFFRFRSTDLHQLTCSLEVAYRPQCSSLASATCSELHGAQSFLKS
jgi:hypothetical protein